MKEVMFIFGTECYEVDCVEGRKIGKKYHSKRALSAASIGQRVIEGREFLDEWILCEYGWPVWKPASHSKIY